MTLRIRNIIKILCLFLIYCYGKLYDSIFIKSYMFEIYIGTYGQNSQRDRNNWFLELISAFQLFVFIKPVIFPISAYFIIPFCSSNSS